VEYILHSIGEFLLFPSLICSLYGFINERSWTFDNGIAGCNFLLFVHSIGMDVGEILLQLVSTESDKNFSQ